MGFGTGFQHLSGASGLWQIADMERDGRTLDVAATARAMAPYVEAGFTTFDMADHYGSAEEIAGRFAHEQETGTVQLLTKWVPEPGPKTREDVRHAVQSSLKRMQTDCLDVLQFHTWAYSDPGYLDCLFYLQELKEEGLIRHLGLSYVDTAHLRVIVNSGIDIVSNQVCFSLLDQRARTNDMTAFCRAHGITLLAFGTLAPSILSSTKSKGRYDHWVANWKRLSERGSMFVIWRTGNRWRVRTASAFGRSSLPIRSVRRSLSDRITWLRSRRKPSFNDLF